MKYLVMENHESHSIVMDESGTFHRVANLEYEIGDTVTEPIFMKTPEKQKEKKLDWKKVSTIAAIFVCFILATIPFINNQTQSDIMVYMSINPEIHLEMSDDGKINRIVADNEDGKTLLDGYDCRGKSAADVLIELIDRAESLKFLSKGGDIHITVEAPDNNRGEKVSIDLSEVLNDTYHKKYLIKVRVNEGSFNDIDVVAGSHEETTATEEMKATESYSHYTYYYTDYYTETAAPSSEKETAAATTEPTTAATKPTEHSKPAAPTTEPATGTTETKPTVVTEPTEITEATEPTTDPELPSDDDSDDDWPWPWWPWPYNN